MLEVGLRRFVLVSLFVTLLGMPPVLLPSTAEAVTINLNVGSNISSGRSISCVEGRRQLRRRGFRDVRTIDCRGRFFVYHAWRGARRYEIAINRQNGRVLDVRQIRR